MIAHPFSRTIRWRIAPAFSIYARPWTFILQTEFIQKVLKFTATISQFILPMDKAPQQIYQTDFPIYGPCQKLWSKIIWLLINRKFGEKSLNHINFTFTPVAFTFITSNFHIICWLQYFENHNFGQKPLHTAMLPVTQGVSNIPKCRMMNDSSATPRSSLCWRVGMGRNNF